ncbi:MAG: hypothetical protein HY084_11640 [Gemmatimonadetes bacterium]|nr:hypothetical protein [Gemmatimonadota bacterium]
MKWSNNIRAVAALGAVIVAAGACDRSTAPHGLTPVRFRIAASTAIPGASAGLLSANGPLEIATVQLVLGRAALGAGSEFGCHDCEGNFTDETMAPTLVTLTAAEARVDVLTEPVSPGRYGAAELSLTPLPAGTTAGLRDAPAGTTMRVEGRFNGVPFRLDLAIDGTFRGALVPPLDVSSGGASVTAAVTMRLPVDRWFASSSGVLDPTKAADRALIASNIRSSFAATEAEASASER